MTAEKDKAEKNKSKKEISKKTIYLIDTYSLAHRAFYALPLLTNSAGEYTNSVYGFTRMLLSLIDDKEPDMLAAAFDMEAPTFRHEAYEDYKADRKETPEELKPQFALIREVLEEFNIPIYEKEGFEADDIIGTLAKQASSRGYKVVIITGDRDALQLVEDNIEIMYTRKGLSDIVTYDLSRVREDYELEPEQLIDRKGLMGDSSDNIPGVPGIGKKTAKMLLNEFKDLDTILDNIEEVSGKKRRESLRKNSEQALMSRELGRIETDVPVEFDPDCCKWGDYQEGRIYELFSRLGFNSMLDRFEADRLELTAEDYTLVENLTENDREELRKKTLETGFLNLAVYHEDYSMPVKSRGRLLLSPDEKKVYFLESEEIEEFADLLEEKTIVKRTVRGKEVLIEAGKEGVEISNIKFEPRLASYLLEPSSTVPDLKTLLESELEVVIQEDLEQQELLALVLTRQRHLEQILISKLENNELDELYREIEIPLLYPLAAMELNGIRLDCNYLEELSQKWSGRIEEIVSKAHNLAGEEFNLNSPKQVGEILFEKLGLPVIKKTKTGYSTSISVLEKLEDQHEIVPLIIEYRHWSKLKSTYLEALPPLVNPETGRLHTSFNQMVTATGRLSSTNPNLQNIPIRSEEGREIRRAFIPQDENWVLLSADYSQIELRILAHISQDENLLDTYRQGGDIHNETARGIFEVDSEEVTGNMRRKAKVINFGIAYGMSAYRLADDLDISQQEAEEYIEKYFTRFSGVREYMDNICQEARDKGFVTTILKRKRYIPEINSKNYHRRSFAERTAINTPIQGSAADIMKIAMNSVHRRLKEDEWESRLLLQVHDELVLEVPRKELEDIAPVIKSEMEEAYEIDVPLIVDLEIGPTWKDKEKYNLS